MWWYNVGDDRIRDRGLLLVLQVDRKGKGRQARRGSPRRVVLSPVEPALRGGVVCVFLKYQGARVGWGGWVDDNANCVWLRSVS